MLDRIDEATAMERRLNARVEERIRPFERQVRRWALVSEPTDPVGRLLWLSPALRPHSRP
jgi:hypothetical protein